MARQVRLEFPGAFYHVISRGEKRQDIFLENDDRFRFIEKLEETFDKFKIKVHCYVLMNNHFHLLLETPLGNLSKAIHFLNTSYSNWFKAKHKIIGSVFQGRYKSILVDKEEYLLVLSAYIHLNPVRAKIVKMPAEYKWSSFASYVFNCHTYPWLFTTEILELFSGNRGAYEQYVVAQHHQFDETTTDEFRGKNSILGSDDFTKESKARIAALKEKIDHREKPDLKHLSTLDPEFIRSILFKIFCISEKDLMQRCHGNIYRKLYSYSLKKYTSLSLREIGSLIDMDYSAVSQMINRFIIISEHNDEVKRFRNRLDAALKSKS